LAKTKPCSAIVLSALMPPLDDRHGGGRLDD
jgi:hypothetical protein